MFDYWKKKCLVQVRQLDDSLAQAMQVASSPEEWKSRGIKLYREHNYEMATMCFERAGDTYWERRSKAAEIFDAIGKADSAARCFSDLGEYERACMTLLTLAICPVSLGFIWINVVTWKEQENVFLWQDAINMPHMCTLKAIFSPSVSLFEHPVEDTAVATRGIDNIEQEFLESCARVRYS
ncbi:hypothetical protein D8674_015605 [Pyrus ussuriensis x Pyrus communis]|uniref:Uncharacterized protein n=1 Tax=Pyrus ussuriensis x Pyrus communis TaxID=2448454 RepID=A0A5N5H7I0_9ROSA|nr:hypothetical protein D8674_015605 [Pyrus ussuriensis x Pyrus communis]